MFTKIQDALDALMPGQVVEVLDKGPYRESLLIRESLSDVGLISRTQTTVTASEQFKSSEASAILKVQRAHRVRIEGFKIEGTTIPKKSLGELSRHHFPTLCGDRPAT